MSRPTKIIHNTETNEIIEREFNDEELAQYEIDVADLEAKRSETVAKAAQKAALLDRLGITEDEAKLLLG
jgi:DNA/RNA endonuclease G (NUC1)